MTTLPNPFLNSAAFSSLAAESGAACSPPSPMSRAAPDPFNDEPLPLFLTEPAPELDRELEALLRVIFGVPG